MIRSKIMGAIALINASPLVSATPAPHTADAVVVTSSGRVSGHSDEKVAAFLGIPYAAPPTGDNRWQPPKPVSWPGTHVAEKFGPSCPQSIFPSLGPWTHEYLPSGATSEDCLTLNIWKPAKVSGKLPVMVWIHGGGFTSGSSSVEVYDGSELAKKGIIVVSINYRVGFLGSLASPDFRNSGGGNFGVQDQIAALRWVRDNINAFGGDPKRVTISGQSAGAFSVHYLMLSPQAKGLFQRAIPQSGAGLGTGYDLWLDTRENAEKSAVSFLAAAGVSSLDEARKLPVEKLRAAYFKAGGVPGSANGFRTKPYADGAVLPLDPAAALKAGHYNDTPVLIGLTADEGSGLDPAYRTADAARYATILRLRFGKLGEPLAKLYPVKDGVAPLPSVIRDSGIAATIAWGKERNRKSRFPMYSYLWTYVEPGPESARYGAFHTSEVPYVFGTLAKSPERNFTDLDRRVAEIMQSYWVNFVKTGNPNGKGLPNWPQFEKGEKFMELGKRFAPFKPLDPAAEELFTSHIKAGGSLFGS